MEEKTEGITLKVTAFKENSRIIQIFSKDFGIISLLIKRISPKKSNLLALSTPFCHGEFLLKKNKGDIFSFLDGNILHHHLALRNDFNVMQAASKCIRSILKTQFQEKHAPMLFQLLSSYLKAIPSFQDPFVLMSSFYLKLLHYESLLHLSDKCNLCSERSVSIYRGESLCHTHASPYGFRFTKDEISTMNKLVSARNFSSLKEISLEKDLKKKIELLFEDLI